MPVIVNNKPITKSLKEYARGITGGLVFSLPLLYTMEVWWAGFIVSPIPLIILMVVTFILLLGYNRYAGVRPDVNWQEILIDSVEELGLGFIISFLVLLMLDRIQLFQMHLNEMMGKVIVEAMAVSIGVSIGKSQLGEDSGQEDSGKESEQQQQKKGDRDSMWGIAALAVCGSVVVGSNVAPTQEILVIAVEAEPVHILCMAVFSVLISVVVVYFSDFEGTAFRRSMKTTIYDMIFGTAVCYLMALATSTFLLWFFGRFENMSLWNCVAQVIVLGVPAALGASAGRLLIK
jgi:putative integral membrane protein (TIGR02587 family)